MRNPGVQQPNPAYGVRRFPPVSTAPYGSVLPMRLTLCRLEVAPYSRTALINT
ncbi:MAG: hypothetical protein ACI835_005296 [Planctomycetota bacterium]|jgi:hypothetical protein